MAARSSREPAPLQEKGASPSLFRLRSSLPEWLIERVGYQPEMEHQIESQFTVSNGFLGTRGSLEWPMPTSRPRTYVAGLFDVAVTEPPVPTLYPGPNWLSLRWTLDAEMISPGRGELSFQNRVLDLRHGILWTEWRQQDIHGRTLRVRTLRLVSLAARKVAVQAAEFTVDRSAHLTLEAWLDGERTGLVAGHATSELSTWRTHSSEQYLAVGSSSVLRKGERRMRPATPHRGGTRRQRWTWNATPGQPVTFTRLVSFVREEAGNPSPQALEVLRAARRGGVRRLIQAHTNAWEERWAASDVRVDGDPEALRALRFSMYHLIAAANPEDEHVSIGARGLTGDAYRGHVFWDTEIFLLPFYTHTWPEAARALLMYRYHTLPAARAKAEQYGYRGAFYAWEAAGHGEEATPPYVIDASHRAVVIHNAERELHISAAVAYAVWEYWQTTGDDAFLVEAGAEILLETARFWASRATLEDDGRYHLRTVIGPDEYHDLVHDNAYTNVMAQWNIERALEALDFVAQRFPPQGAILRDRLGLAEEELDQWRTVSNGLVTGYDPATGLFEQFEGFFDLKPVFAAGFSERTVPLDVLLGPETTHRSQVVKQADVVMLMALLQDRFPARTIEANFRFYEARCGHGSSLSPPMHALVAARLGDVATAERYFRQSAAVDLDDLMGNASLGVHMATLGGLWQVAVFGFAGLSRMADGLRLAPRLPPGWDSLVFRAQWHGTEIEIELRRAPALVTVTHLRGNALTIHLDTAALPLRPGESWTYGSSEF